MIPSQKLSSVSARTSGRAKTVVIMLVLGSAFASACRREKAPAPAASSDGVKRGDVVVFERTAAEFREGRVLEAASGRLRIEPAEGGESLWIQSSDVYELDRGHAPKSGELAICRPQPRHWVPCRIETSDSVTVTARDATDRTLSLTRDAVLAARPVTALNLKRHFERAAERKNFSESFARAGEPVRSPKWVPAPRARVMARLEGRWYLARIHEYDEETPRVELSLDERITEFGVADLAPSPPYDTSDVHRGDFVLVKPAGPAEPFRAGQIRGIGDQQFRVADIDGSVREVSARDVVPLSPVTPAGR